MINAWPILLLFAAIGIYTYIAYTDFTRLKITNGTVLILMLAALLLSVLDGAVPLGTALLVGIIFFALTFPFWIFGAIGAGDVKLIAASGLLVGLADAFNFALLLLLCSLLTIGVISLSRYLLFLPAPISQRFLALLNEKQIPYGIPVASAAITILALRAISLV